MRCAKSVIRSPWRCKDFLVAWWTNQIVFNFSYLSFLKSSYKPHYLLILHLWDCVKLNLKYILISVVPDQNMFLPSSAQTFTLTVHSDTFTASALSHDVKWWLTPHFNHPLTVTTNLNSEKSCPYKWTSFLCFYIKYYWSNNKASPFSLIN